jgi:hypothetical protein
VHHIFTSGRSWHGNLVIYSVNVECSLPKLSIWALTCLITQHSK